MKVIVRTRTELVHNSELTMGMHRLRGRVFKERLDWDVSVSKGLEIDQYDTFKPTYLLALEQRDVVGCVRLLSTTGRNMLADTFPVLLDGNAAPKAASIWESSRFCVDTKSVVATAENGLREATFLLFAAMIEWGQQRDLRGHRNGHGSAHGAHPAPSRLASRPPRHTSSNRGDQSRGWTVADHHRRSRRDPGGREDFRACD